MGKVTKKGPNPGFFAKGGNTKMFGPGHAAPSPEGQSVYESQPGGSGKFAVGGKGHMFGPGHAGAMPAGQSSKSSQ